MDEWIDRRALLRAGGLAGVGLLAGCSDEEDMDGSTTNGTAEGTTTVTETSPAPADCPEGPIEADEEPGTATLWHNRLDGRTISETDLIETARSQFNSVTDHSIETSRIPDSSFVAYLTADIPEGDGPYLFEWRHSRAGRFDSDGYLSDQSGNVDIPKCMITDSARRAARYRGKRIGVPWAAETVALFYNEDMVDSPPETLAEMKSVMSDYHDPENGKYGLGFPVDAFYVSGFAQAYGEDIYDGEADELGLNTDEVQKGLRVVMEDLKPYMPEGTSRGDQRPVFENGNAPFYIGGPWDLSALRDAKAVDLGVTTLPDLSDGGTPRPYMGVKLFYFASKMDTGASAGAARDFAEWFASNEQLLLEHANKGNFIPVHAGLVDDPAMPDSMAAFARQFEDAYPMPQNPKMDQVWNPFGDAVVQTFNGNGDLGENLAAAEAEIRADWADD